MSVPQYKLHDEATKLFHDACMLISQKICISRKRSAPGAGEAACTPPSTIRQKAPLCASFRTIHTIRYSVPNIFILKIWAKRHAMTAVSFKPPLGPSKTQTNVAKLTFTNCVRPTVFFHSSSCEDKRAHKERLNPYAPKRRRPTTRS